MPIRVKICGITRADQALAIGHLGATTLGFICVPASPRYIEADQIGAIAEALQADAHTAGLQRIGVFVDAPVAQIQQVVDRGQLTGVQLHGSETPQTCQLVKQALPHIELIKAFRVRSPETLQTVAAYDVDTLLLDAFHPQAHGGTGQTLDWRSLRDFQSPRPWLLAGGLKPSNVAQALGEVTPSGIDLSSGVEHSPGQKNIAQVSALFEALRSHSPTGLATGSHERLESP